MARSWNLKKRFLRNRFWFGQLLRRRVARPIAFMLLAVFLLAQPVSFWPGLHDWSNLPFAQALSASETPADLYSERVENHECGNRRLGAERFPSPTLEFRDAAHPELIAGSFLTPPGELRASACSPLHGTSGCDAPFSPRPPPVHSLQG